MFLQMFFGLLEVIVDRHRFFKKLRDSQNFEILCSNSSGQELVDIFLPESHFVH